MAAPIQSSTQTSNSSGLNGRSAISVAPVGVNLGEITKFLDQGSVPNGGSGFQIPSRFASTPTAKYRSVSLGDTVNAGPNWLLIGGIGAVALIGVFVVLKVVK